MPRKARPNRTDMLSQPVRVPSGGKYGAAKESAAAQQAVPLAQQNPTAPPPVDMQTALAAAQAFQMPTPVNAPTDRPMEPLTHGLSMGPGGGPEVLQNPGANGLLIRGIAALRDSGDVDPNMQRLLRVAEATLHQRGMA